MKRILAAFVLSIFTFSVSALASFTDTSSYKWQASVEYLQEVGIVNGYEDGSFKPDNQINRAEFMKMVMEGFYYVYEEDAYNCFTDVNGDEWYAKYVCLGKDLGIVDGRPDGSFDPAAKITQPEALKIIFNALEEEVTDFGGEWYQQYLDHAEWLGMYYFSVDSPAAYSVTRGETSYFITWLTSPEWLDQIDATDFYGDDVDSYFDLYEEVLGYYEMEAEDCFPGETYDAEAKLCYIDCDTIEECQEKEQQVYDAAIAILNESVFTEDNYEENLQAFEVEPDEEIAFYTVDGNEISLVSDSGAYDKSIHTEIWDRFVELFPEQERKYFNGYRIFTDGVGGYMAAVEIDENNPDFWSLNVDPADTHPDGLFDDYSTTFTLIHEFAHVMTLNVEQFDHVWPFDEADYLAQESNCKPNYYTFEGCSFDNSYANLFHQEFWKEIADEWHEADYVYDPEVYDSRVTDLYNKYSDRFVTDYAATNLAEDIADSFTFFVLEEKSTGTTVADKKINFFYQFEELVALREIIRQRL